MIARAPGPAAPRLAALAAALLLLLLAAPGSARAQEGGGYDPDPGAPQETAVVTVLPGPDG